MTAKYPTILLALLGIGPLAACSLECVNEKPNALEVASEYPHGGPWALPLDTWVENPKLELFFRQALQTEKSDALSAKYGMQCLPAPPETACNDCFTCRKAIRQWHLGMATPPIPIYMEIFKCVDYGEVLMRAEFGPASSVKVMTYWKTTPVAREVEARASAEWRLLQVPRRPSPP